MKVDFVVLYDKKTGAGLGVELPDKTIMLVDTKNKGFRIAFPRNKFAKIFQKQIKQKRKYLEVIFNDMEVEMLFKALHTKRGGSKNLKGLSEVFRRTK